MFRILLAPGPEQLQKLILTNDAKPGVVQGALNSKGNVRPGFSVYRSYYKLTERVRRPIRLLEIQMFTRTFLNAYALLIYA